MSINIHRTGLMPPSFGPVVAMGAVDAAIAVKAAEAAAEPSAAEAA